MQLLDMQGQPLWLNVVVFAIAGAVVWFGGARVTRALDAISEKTGVGRVFIGMLLLGGITSLPEVANVITASATGVPPLAINNLLGSAAINVVLIALVDAVVGREAATSVVANPATLMMCALCMMVLGFVGFAIAIGDVAVFGVGLWSVLICTASVGAFALAVRYGPNAPWAVRDSVGEHHREPSKLVSTPLRRLIWITAAGAVIIFAAGYVLSETGEVIATQSGLGAGFVGFLLIGLATSLPELSTITAAVKLRQHEMAFGQVIGTNFVNLSLFVLADVVYRGGPVVNELGRFEIASAVLALLLIGIFLVGLLERRDATVGRMGYDSFAVIVTFLGGAVLLYTIR
jgi:cation:H+ antiporter